MNINDIPAVVRIGLAGIPYVGGAMAQAYSEWDSSRRNKRIQDFMNTVNEKLKQLNRFPNPTDMTDADWQILEEILRIVQIEHVENKRKFFANLLVNCWSNLHSKDLLYDQMFITALNDFSQYHIAILSRLMREKHKRLSFTQLLNLYNTDTFYMGNLFSFINDLTIKYPFVMSTYQSKDLMNSNDADATVMSQLIPAISMYRISEQGEKFLSFIQTPE